MDTKTYLDESARTLSGLFHLQFVPSNILMDTLRARAMLAPELDQIKKALFYGKDTEELAFKRRVLGDDVSGYGNVPDDLIHGILGMATESDELLEVLGDSIHNGIVDEEALKRKLRNEIGDSLWYTAVLLRYLGVSFEEVMADNIAKLYKRYPDKFSMDLAVNRDESKENVVFQ